MKVKLIWINLLLGLFILFEGYMIYQVWARPDNWKISSGSATGPGNRQNLLTLVKRGGAKGSFSDVVNKNVFSMHRKEFVPKPKPKPKPVKKPPIAKAPEPEIVKEPPPLDSNRVGLCGVLVVGDYCKALVTDASDREKPEKWVQQGDKVDKFAVERIQKDRIILSGAGKLYTVLLYDTKNPKKRRRRQPASAAPGPATAAKKDVRPSSAPGKKSPPKKKNNDKYEIIKTPFGEFKRKKP